MPRDRTTEAVGILSGIVDRVERVEERISTTEGLANLLRSVIERPTTDDAIDANEYDARATDETTTDDPTNALENDAATTDRATNADTTSRSVGDRGGWLWGQSEYDFDEWESVLKAFSRLFSDRSTIDDSVNTRENDTSANDRSKVSETVTASSSPSGNWTWN